MIHYYNFLPFLLLKRVYCNDIDYQLVTFVNLSISLPFCQFLSICLVLCQNVNSLSICQCLGTSKLIYIFFVCLLFCIHLSYNKLVCNIFII